MVLGAGLGAKRPEVVQVVLSFLCLHQESNPDLSLRTGLLYPLSYGGERNHFSTV